MQIIRKNFGLKLLALVLAIVGWTYFRFATNPIVAAAHFNQQLSIPIAPMNLASGLILHDADTSAVVTVDRKPGAPAVRPDEIRAVLDLSNKGAGVYNVPIQLVAPDVAVQSLSPASVTLSIERSEERSFTIVVHYVGSQPGVVVADQQIQPKSVTVQGPSSILSQVTAVRVDVVLPNAPVDADESLRAQPVNAMGTEVAGLQVAPNLVRVETKFAAARGAGGH
ncbi:MAG TPA: CdaR family protein [Candidatus Baltobacteraceae bacterium]|nr:CdaR family protein [Candidatus Baltobacteraceae bacterium]